MKGKDKCKILKEIRAEIARANDIAWVTENCTHKGECRGTCPKCEAEVLTLERALARRRALGKTVAVVGLSAGMIATTASCEAYNDLGNAPTDGMVDVSAAATTMEIAGVPMLPETEVLDGDIEVDGEMVPLYYSTDFTSCAELSYRAVELLYIEPLEDIEYDDTAVWEIQPGEEFHVIGECPELYMILVRYRGQVYCTYNDYLHFAEMIEPEVGI